MGGFKLGLVTAILFVVAIVNDWSTPDDLIITLMIVLAIAWIWSRISLHRLGFSRSLSLDRVRAGESVSEEMRLRNHALLPKLWVECRDHSSLPGYRAGRVVNLGSKGEARWETRAQCWRRGRFRLGPVTIRSGDPLGLFQVEKLIPATHELIVYPVALDVSGVPLPAANMSGGRATNRNMAIAAHTISGLRDYAPGDPLNRISWSATARRGQMMVKEFDPDPTSDVWVLVDLGGHWDRPPAHWTEASRSHERDGDAAFLDNAEEVVIALAASVAERALDEGRRVGLLVNRAMPIRLEPDNSQRQWFRIFETLALATAFGQRSLVEAIAADARKFSRTSGLVVITASSSRNWVASAQALVQRQVPVTAVIVEGALYEGDEDIDLLVEDLAAAHVALSRFDIHGRSTSVHQSFQLPVA
jgi:uncharacterized protein (DUF58 family)